MCTKPDKYRLLPACSSSDSLVVPFLDLSRQHFQYREEIDKAISDVIRDTAFVSGVYVKEFEKNFARYQHASHCVAVGNGTDALEIAIEALELPPGSEIIVPANSFIASSEAVSRTGHRIVFCDCETDDYTLSIEDLKKRISPKTAAIMAVHLYGHPCDMDALKSLVKIHKLKIIEDCAQAHGAEYKGRKVGAIGDIGTFSFYPGKNLGAYGDGGAIVTHDGNLARRCRMIANHGRIDKYNHEFEGRNSRMDGIQGAVLNVKLKYIDEWTTARIRVARFYLAELARIPELILPSKQSWAKQVYHLFVIRTSHRDQLQEYLKSKKIQTGVHYPIALPRLKAYAHMRCEDVSLAAENMADQLLSLPIGEHLTTEMQQRVVMEISTFFSRFIRKNG